MSTIVETITTDNNGLDPVLAKKQRHYQYRLAHLATDRGKEENRERALNYYYKNRDKILQTKKEQSGELAAYKSAYYESHKEELKAKRRERYILFKV